jgi:hypothetical protein
MELEIQKHDLSKEEHKIYDVPGKGTFEVKPDDFVDVIDKKGIRLKMRVLSIGAKNSFSVMGLQDGLKMNSADKKAKDTEQENDRYNRPGVEL